VCILQANASMESLQKKKVLKDVDSYSDELNGSPESKCHQGLKKIICTMWGFEH
jgi:hypothetical protein